MYIEVNTDANIEGSEELTLQVKTLVVSSLDRFRDKITHTEVHLSDENSHKAGPNDKRCVIEVRLAGLQPIAATNNAATLDLAISGAIEKLERLIDSTLGRRDHLKRTVDREDQTP
ncbi:MAG: HPF/RaiA family ribosome-associated protein [Nitrosospira sp.]